MSKAGLTDRLRALVSWPMLDRIQRVPPGSALGFWSKRRRAPVIMLGDVPYQLPALRRSELEVGDLLVWTGSRFERLPVGTDGKVLTADSTDPLGVVWDTVSGSGGGGSTPDFTEVDAKYMRWNAILGTGQMVDGAGNTLQGGGTSAVSPQAEGGFLRQFRITGNDWAGFRALPTASITPTQPRWSPIWRGRWRTLTSTEGGFAVGLWGATQPQDNPAGSSSGLHAAFRCYTGTDSFITAASSDGTNTETTATSTAIASDTVYELEIRVTTSSVAFYLNGSLVATHSTYLPGSTSSLGPIMQVRRLVGATGTAEIACHSMSLVTL